MKRLELNEPRESLKKEITSLREQVRQLNNVNDAKEHILVRCATNLRPFNRQSLPTKTQKLKFCTNF